MSLSTGHKLGHYEILEPIGKGGMGEVYRAKDSKLGRDVAIKVLPEEFAADPERLARFEREAKLLASLNHPNIAAIHGFEEADGVNALVLELVEGPTLAERIAEGPIPVDEAIAIAKQTAEALEAGHEAGVIHRDLKPANIKLKEDGTVKVLDYGLAKALAGETPGGAVSELSQSPTLTRQTQVGMILGTAAYMSPEQAKGKAVDKRTDVWAFGAVLYEMLAGRQPFEGDDVAEELAAVVGREPDWTALPSHLSVQLSRLVRRCLTKDLRSRLRDIGDVRIYFDEPPDQTHALDQSQKWRWAPWGVTILLGLFIAVTSLAPTEPRAVTRLHLEIPEADSLLGADEIAGRVSGASVIPSPDGRRLAYVAGSPTKLFVRNLSELDATELSGTEGARAPFFSPDGEWIAFFTDNTLEKVSVAGGAPLTICGANSLSRGGSWGEDDTIVFAGDASVGLSRVAASGGTPEDLTSLDSGERSHRWPQILPGSKAVLYTVQRQGERFDDGRVDVHLLKEGVRKTVLKGGTYPRYVPSGHLVYVHEGTLFAAAFDLEELELRGQPTPVLDELPADVNGGAQFAFSEDGTLIYRRGGRSNEMTVQWVDREGRLTPLAGEPSFYRDLALSPDGSRLALAKASEASGFDIWVIDLNRGVQTRLTSEPSYNGSPVWTPDGEYLVFGSARAGAANLYRKRADGTGDVERLTESPNVQNPSSISPDGTIAFTEFGEDGNDVWVLSLDGDEPQVFLQTPQSENRAAFSPDGRFLAYESRDSGGAQIHVISYPDKKSAIQVSTTGGSRAVWSPVGRELFYHHEGEIMMVPYEIEGDSFKPGVPRVLISNVGFVGGGARPFDVTPDGERFVILAAASDYAEAPLILIQNWFTELERLVPTP